jgi:nitrite reductase/ring-hydroxylating ferredoxin subunit
VSSEALPSADFVAMVDSARGLVDRRIFSDEEIYRLELEHIFARAWNFMAHDSQIPNPGDFFTTYIGEDRVIVVRDKAGQPQVLLNTCRHRGNAVCRAEEGHATSFMCTYHGWTYDLQGKLVGVPGLKDNYHNELNRDEWGLIRAAQVATYQGFIFATLDPEAPPLDEYLGEVGRLGIDLLVAAGDTRVADGIQKWTIPCNWKLAVDNVWDWYHADITHASALLGGWRFGEIAKDGPPARIDSGSRKFLSILGDYGHAIGGPDLDLASPLHREGGPFDNTWRLTPEARRLLGAVGVRSVGHPNIFPNLWFMPGFSKVSLRLPKGPTKTEIWWFAFYNPEHDEARKLAGIRRQTRHDGPAGMFEQEDGENWGQSTRGTAGTAARRYPLNYGMNVGQGVVIDDETGPPHIDSGVNEHSQLWYYKCWTDWMAAMSWRDLRANHSPVPDRL